MTQDCGARGQPWLHCETLSNTNKQSQQVKQEMENKYDYLENFLHK